MSVVQVILLLPATAEMYKYENEDGVTVLDSHVPARYVRSGYTVLSDRGRVLKVVPRAPTPEERREQERKKQEAERMAREKRERMERDQMLMRLYSRPEDVIRARDSKLASIQGTIDTSVSNLKRLEDRKRALEAELANIERAGGTISQDRLDRIDSVESRIEQTRREIESKRKEMEETRSSFNTDLERVRKLYNERIKQQTTTASEEHSS